MSSRPTEAPQTQVLYATSIVLLVSFVALLLGFTARPEFKVSASAHPAASNKQSAAQTPQTKRLAEINERFEQGVAMLHAKKYEFAITSFHKVIELSPNLVDAHVNMGYALLGLKKYKAAGDFFANAIRLDSYKVNAYWGLAVSLEGLGDKQAALGAMRAYVHLAPPSDPFVTRARSAMWEWENDLKRGPLPKEESQFLARGAKQWEDRNSPEVDKPASGATAREPIDLLVPGAPASATTPAK